MGQAVMDLPNPLDNPAAAAPGASADDLLAKLAGDEIDRLLAESDIEPAAGEPSAAAATVTPTTPESAAPVQDSAVKNPVAAVDLDAVLETAEAERAALQNDSVDDEEFAGASHIDLGETAERRKNLPIIFKPLVWLSAPLDPWPDQLREILGKIAVVTLINALAVIAYVFLFRRHH